MNKIIAFDLDDVLCYRTSEEGAIAKYYTCKPIQEMIDIANQMYDLGHTILIYTARGMSSFKGQADVAKHHLYDITVKQLDKWGVKYHQLYMGKIHYDILIDDKALNSLDVNSIYDITLEKWDNLK